jgi:dihydrofolate reductase (trimethoprim resistance protein)
MQYPSTHTKFKHGDSVRKTKGSQWHGRVVGWYSTDLTPEGYAVESNTERGSVQIYPAVALELWRLTPNSEVQENSADYLAQRGIPFVSKNGGAHLIVEGKDCFIDFWPGTGKWHSRCGKKGFGVRNLVAFVETPF